MSRIGKKPITLPQGVKLAQSKGCVKVAGPLGSLDMVLRGEMSVEVSGNAVNIIRKDESRLSRSLHGLTRTLIANMVKGVAEGFEKKLDIVGIGYKAEVKGDKLNLALGFSHPIVYDLPKGIGVTVEKQTNITLKGADKQLLGQVAAEIRSLRPPEPYKGKGIKYSDEVIRRKA
ncbi:MAG: 50S ribosomal protein L6, partial [Deltaproteobacteria bacterium]|nr:50S ribosomal protein L6 [Deltaproteobacteria bacterium]